MISICVMLVAAGLAESAQNTAMLGNAESRILLLEHAWNKAKRRVAVRGQPINTEQSLEI